MSEQSTLSGIQEQLITALEKSRNASKTLEDARAKLAPLEAKALEAQEQVNKLMNEYNRLTGKGPAKSRRGGVPGPRKAYVISDESKIAATEKRSYTKAINAGKNEAEAKKVGKDAAKALAAKLGMK
jgi:outer membrane protein TolC